MPRLSRQYLPVILLALSYAPAAWAAEPARPGAVDSGARYQEAARVWILESGGRQVVWYESGVKKAEGGFVNRQREGQWTFYYPNGARKGEGAFRANLREGGWKLYASAGYLQAEGAYKADRREGPWKTYYASGRVASQGPYLAGKKHGEWVNYYEDGQVFYRGAYQTDAAHGPWVYFFANGQPFQQGHFQNDVRVGSWRICIQPGGPCGDETYSAPAVPRRTGLTASDLFPRAPANASDPGAVLDSLENGGVPDSTPRILGEGWD